RLALGLPGLAINVSANDAAVVDGRDIAPADLEPHAAVRSAFERVDDVALRVAGHRRVLESLLAPFERNRVVEHADLDGSSARRSRRVGDGPAEVLAAQRELAEFLHVTHRGDRGELRPDLRVLLAD